MAGGIKILTLSEVTTPVGSMAIGIADSATTNVYITIANLQKLWVTNVDANGNNLIGLSYLESNISPPAAIGVIRLGLAERISWRHSADASDNYIEFETVTNNFIIAIQGTEDFAFTSTRFEINTHIIQAANTLHTFGDTGTGWKFNQVTGNTTDIRINAQDEYIFSASALNILGNDIDNIQNLIHDLSTSGTDVDFDEDELQEISISANTTFTGTGYAIGKTKVVKITTDGTLRTLTFPSGWVFIGGAAPADQAASKQAILSLTCFTGAEAGVIASYAVEP